jgi:lipoic acid synthetase
MILGDICTRGCTFCAVTRGQPQVPDHDEPERLAHAVNALGLRHVVITSPTRDDLADGGAHHYVRVTETLRKCCHGVKIELLVPDFKGADEALAAVLASRPDILAHNLETVPRLYSEIRKGANYRLSLDIIRKTRETFPGIITKSGIMLGLGETGEEVKAVLGDLRQVGCTMLTLGQYLAPSLRHCPVARYVKPEEFECWYQKAVNLGFESVAAGPLVRSSYRASHYFNFI